MQVLKAFLYSLQNKWYKKKVLYKSGFNNCVILEQQLSKTFHKLNLTSQQMP